MKRISASILLFFASMLAIHAENAYWLPQIANGQYGGMSFRTTFILFNRGTATVQLRLTLTDDSGNPMVVTFPGRSPASTYFLTLAPGQTQFLQTDGSGPLVTGGAHALTYNINPLEVGVSAVFSIYTNHQFTTEAGVGDSPAQGDFVIPVDSHGDYSTSVALYNAGGSATPVSMKLYNTAGQQVASQDLDPLNPGSHVSRFVAGEYFKNITQHQGILRLTGDELSNISALVIRQYSKGSKLCFTTLPAIALNSTQRSFNLPQIANGVMPGLGTFKTTFILFNVSDTAATVTVTTTKDAAGNPFPITIPGVVTSGSTFQVNLARNGSAFLQTDGGGTLTSGAARISSTADIGVCAIFTVYDEGGNFKTEAGVRDSSAFDALTLPVDTTGSFNTGVALFNPSSTPVDANMTFLDLNGEPLGDCYPTHLSGYGHDAKFVTEFVGQGNRQGTLAITATSPVVAVALRQYYEPPETVFSTLPVVEYAFSATAPASSLLSASQSGIDVHNATEINSALIAGSRLHGTITPPQGSDVSVDEVLATEGQKDYSGAYSDANRHYLIVTPGGSYNLTVRYTLHVSDNSWTGLTYEKTGSVQVNGTTAADLTLPAVTRRNVSGKVTGLASVSSNSGVFIRFSSPDGSTTAQSTVGASGDYQVSLPAGSYSAYLKVQDLHVGNSLEELNLYLGELTVASSSVTNANYTVPQLATLTCEVAPGGATILATDKSGPNDNLFSTSRITAGDYGTADLLLADSRDYAVRLQFSYENNYFAGDDMFGQVVFPSSGQDVTLAGNGVLQLYAESWSDSVGISGRVTRPDGSGVGGALVRVTSSQLDLQDGAVYQGGITADEDGYYSFIIPVGSYSISFQPPKPMW